MEFRILGPLEVLAEGRVVPLSGKRQRALLALMLLRVNETLSPDELADLLSRSKKTLHVQISRLRRDLAAGGDGLLITRGHGYALELDPQRIDAHRFEELAGKGRRALAEGRPRLAAELLDHALGLWRGHALADLAYESFAQDDVRRLEDARLVATGERIDADLALGRHAEVIGQLQRLIATHPDDELLRARLMLALYRCDRQAEALDAFQDARKALNEIGLQVGDRLRELHGAVLNQDPALVAPAPPSTAGVAQPLPGARRLMTVVAASVDETAGESSDPESLHHARKRRQRMCEEVFGRHGGTVEHIDGRVVTALFGLRSFHEDDALRAVRAALELRAASAATVGIGSGKMFVGAGLHGEPVATGDASAAAARLCERAADGEILLADQTYRLVARHIQAEAVAREGPRALRLLELHAAETVAGGTPFVGREPERAALLALLRRVTRERICHLATVVGPPGVGKTRLARELAAEVTNEGTIVVGRCLSYGEGVAYRPLTDIVNQLTRGDLERGLAEILDGDDADGAIRRCVLATIAGEPMPEVESFWAMRRLFEAVARRRPLVVAIEDAHFAERALLDLLEYVVSFSRGSPILLLCLARRELIESHPDWGVPQPDRTLVQLEMLADAEAEALVAALGDLDARARSEIVERGGGNPLFLEQLVAWRADSGSAALPLSLEAVLEDRIEQLEPAERRVLEHASVEGRTFHRGAIAALLSDDAISMSLVALVRKQLIRPDRATLAGDDGFRFTHALIREAAYDGIAKERRADLHERLAGWLKGTPASSDEVVGYHLEQVFRLRVEIGAAGAHERELAAEAAERLASAARAALGRVDVGAGARLLERAVTLLDPRPPELLATLGATLIEAGRLADARRFLAEAIDRAMLENDARVESRARVDEQLVLLHEGTSGGHEQARCVADLALAHFERHGDDVGQCRAWRLRAWIDWIECRSARADEAWEAAAVHARRARLERELIDILGWRVSAAALGPTPVPAAIRRCMEIREQFPTSRVAIAVTLHPLGLLHAMHGDFDEARRLVREGDEILRELGRMESAVSHHQAWVEMRAGRPDLAEAGLRLGYDELEQMGERDLLATTAALLAQAVYAQDRLEEADELCRVSERIAAAEDVATQVFWRGVRARICARRGDAERAALLGRQAVRISEPTDLLLLRADALFDLEEVMRLGGRQEDAQAAARTALELCELKGDAVSAARARSRLQAAAPERVG
jgi:DNA-binding SARP family transcriptional activator